MTTVVYNARFGCFSLSMAAIELAKQYSNEAPEWLKLHQYMTSDSCLAKYGVPIDDVIPRHDPVLVHVVKTLGSDASGSCSRLCLVDIPDGVPYRIDEYDGRESVATPDSYNWVKP